jgi:hypothetical protein
MAGVRLSSWQEGECTCSLQIKELELVPKRVGPFTLADSSDVKLSDCRVEAQHQALAGSLQEIGKTLANLTTERDAQGAGYGRAAGAPLHPLIVLPPEIAAVPFSCAIMFPQGRRLSIKAGQAVFAPGGLELQLTAGVEVVSVKGDVLAAEQANWQPVSQQLYVEGEYSRRRGGRRAVGRADQFSLAQGRVRRMQPEAAAAGARSGASEANVMGKIITKLVTGKKLPGSDVFLLPLLAAGAGNMPLTGLGGLTARPGPEANPP